MYQNELNQHLKKEEDKIVTELPEEGRDVHQFFYDINQELSGLIQILLYAQTEQKDN